MLAEPLFIYSQLTQHLVIRIAAEAIALLIRSFSLLLYLANRSSNSVNSENNLLTVFAYGQITASSTYVLVYLIYFMKNKSIAFTHGHDSKLRLFYFSLKCYFTDMELIRVIASFMLQTIVKQVLTEGEKFIMTFFDAISFAEQGAYELVNNLSSLAARFILAPVEESSYLMFCRLVKRTSNLKEQDETNLKTARTFLVNLTKLMTYFGLVVVAFGYNYSHLAILLYAGKKFATGPNSSAVTLMKAQTLYIMVIAVNGVTETFTFASMTQTQLNKFNFVLVALSIILLTLAYFLTLYLGSIGFILANSFNMTLRVAYSILSIGSFWSKSQSKSQTKQSIVKEMLPQIVPLFTLLFSFIVMQISEKILCCTSLLNSFTHLVVGGIIFIFQITVIYKYEKELFLYVYKNIFTKKEQSKTL